MCACACMRAHTHKHSTFAYAPLLNFFLTPLAMRSRTAGTAAMRVGSRLTRSDSKPGSGMPLLSLLMYGLEAVSVRG